VAARFESLNWHVQTIDGMDVDAVDAAIEAAKAETGRPSIICARTIIGFGSPNKADTFGAHGSPLGPDEVIATKENLGIPAEPAFYVPESAANHFLEAVQKGAEAKFSPPTSRRTRNSPQRLSRRWPVNSPRVGMQTSLAGAPATRPFPPARPVAR
jgi:transketolase